MRTRGLEPPRAKGPPGPKPGASTNNSATSARAKGRAHVANDRRARPPKILDLPSMEITSVRPGYEVWRPNREKAETKTTKAIVAFVLLVSAGLLVVITIGGWPRLEGASVGVATLLWAALYVLFALLVVRWNRGILPVASALAIILAIFAAIATPAWFELGRASCRE